MRYSAKARTYPSRTVCSDCVAYVLVMMIVFSAPPALAEESVTVVPGVELADPVVGAKLFREICGLTKPYFTDAKDALRRLNFNLKTDSGTYYHPLYDLSVHVTSTDLTHECSLVAIGKSDLEETSYLYAASIFSDVPKKDREQTKSQSSGPGFLSVFHPSIGYFYFTSEPYEDRTVFHAILSKEELK